MPRLALLLSLTGVLLAGAGCSAMGSSARSSRVRTALEQAKEAKEAAEKLNNGLELVCEGRYNDAIEALFPLVRKFDLLGERSRAAEATLWTAYCYEKLDRWADAETFYQMTVTKYAGTAAAREAAGRLAQRQSRPMR